MCAKTSSFANVWYVNEQMWLIFSNLKLCVEVARRNVKWVKIMLFNALKKIQ